MIAMDKKNRFATTIMLKEIFPDMDSFIAYSKDYYTGTIDDEHKPYMETLLKACYMHFATANIAYDTIDAFKRHLAESMLINLAFYTNKLCIATKASQLSDEELIRGDITIANTASHDNEEVDNPLDEPLKFIETQSSSNTKRNKLESFILYVRNLPKTYIDEFITRFWRHFLFIYETGCYIYKDDDSNNTEGN